MRLHHPNGLDQCSVPPDVTAFLIRFAASHGVRWKATLKATWEAGTDTGPDMDRIGQAKNLIGPQRLHKINV